MSYMQIMPDGRVFPQTDLPECMWRANLTNPTRTRQTLQQQKEQDMDVKTEKTEKTKEAEKADGLAARRQSANRLILAKLTELVERHPDWRFHQILQNYGVNGLNGLNGEDQFYEESETTLGKLRLFADRTTDRSTDPRRGACSSRTGKSA